MPSEGHSSLLEFQHRPEVAGNQGHQSKCISGRIRISATTRWRSTLYEMCSFCYVLLVCVFMHIPFGRNCKEKQEAVALQLRTLYKNKCKHLKFLHLHVFFAIQHEHFQFLPMSTFSSNYISVTVPSGLAIWGHQKSIHLCSPCAQLLHIIRHERETWRARMKDKTRLHVLWQLLWRPSVTQACIVLIKYRTLLVHPPRPTWTGRL